jgi:hypothetical protein
MADKILENKTILTSRPGRMNGIIETKYDYGIYGYTNSDASVIIVFGGRDNLPRGRYEYYSGTSIQVNPNDTNFCQLEGDANENCFHLTNNWYSF